jgi:hypothetical protein
LALRIRSNCAIEQRYSDLYGFPLVKFVFRLLYTLKAVNTAESKFVSLKISYPLKVEKWWVSLFMNFGRTPQNIAENLEGRSLLA